MREQGEKNPIGKLFVLAADSTEETPDLQTTHTLVRPPAEANTHPHEPTRG